MAPNLVGPARALRIALGVVGGPPGRRLGTGDWGLGGDFSQSPVPSPEPPQIAKRIVVAEFAEDPGLLGPPARREVIEQAAQVLELGIEMVVIELGELS